jgi:hypothetical protein
LNNVQNWVAPFANRGCTIFSNGVSKMTSVCRVAEEIYQPPTESQIIRSHAGEGTWFTAVDLGFESWSSSDEGKLLLQLPASNSNSTKKRSALP